MYSMLKRVSAVSVLLIATFVWGCETSTEPVPPQLSPLEVESPDHLLGGLLGTVSDALGIGVDLVQTVVTVVGDLGSAIIGPIGGILEVQDHDLIIPAGAVAQPTAFTMTVIEGRSVEVDLRAIDPETGEDVGEKGFNRPVQLALSYADARIKNRHVDDLVIVRVHEDGTREVLPSTVNRETQQVTAELDHFSRYVLCRN